MGIDRFIKRQLFGKSQDRENRNKPNLKLCLSQQKVGESYY